MDFQEMTPDGETPEFLQFPRFLIGLDDLSLNAKTTYALIYDRARQNAKNKNFIDKNGFVFCFFSNEELRKILNVSVPTITRTISELKKKGLLKREKDKSNRMKMIVFVPTQNIKIDQTNSKDLIRPTIKIDQTNSKGLIRPFPYIVKNNCKEQRKENTRTKDKPEEPPKPKKSSKAQEATKAIIEHWNKSYQTKYSSESKGTIKLVESILKSGYQLEQILQVIDYKAKARRTEADYKWFVPATVLALKNFERNYQFMINDQTKPQTRTVYGSQPNQGYKNKNKIPESVTLPEWYEVKESERANESDVKKILELQNSILKGA